MFWRIRTPSSGHILIHLYEYVIAMLIFGIVYWIIKDKNLKFIKNE
jgi:hypothetical protein